MSNVIKFNHPGRARDAMREQACAWLARLDAGASEADKEALGRWLSQNPDHVELFLETAALWDQASMLKELSSVFPLEQYVPARPPRKGRRELLATAASILVGIGALVTGLDHIGMRWSAGTAALIASLDFETRIGELSTASLPDDSSIILNTNTRVEVRYTRDSRDVYLLRGEGHFTVSKDATRPFRVHAGSNVIEATGTAFAVQRTDESGIAVTVTEGSVSFMLLEEAADRAANPARVQGAPRSAPPPVVSVTVPLVAGEYATADKERAAIEKMKIQPEEIEVRLAWRHGMLLFQGDPLHEVLREISRYTSKRIEADAAVRDILVDGVYLAGDIEGVLVGIQKNFPVDVEEISADHVVLRPR